MINSKKMHSFQQLLSQFEERFNKSHFPAEPVSLYDPAQYILELGGKRIRPLLCLMGSELFGDVREDAFHAAIAVELFHNFTLIHDDIMDKAPLRRGKATVHARYSESAALLAGDTMLIYAYEYLNRIQDGALTRILAVFNKTAIGVCEGQQLDMDFACRPPGQVSMEEYRHMIGLKTSVLLAGSLKMGGILGGAGEGNLQHLYEFGKNMGIAFQVQDDYLDAFGDPEKFGKQLGGDILVNKKTFLSVKAFELADDAGKKRLKELMADDSPGKVEKVLAIYRKVSLDRWAEQEKEKFAREAYHHLGEIAVLSSRKQPLKELAAFLLKRDN